MKRRRPSRGIPDARKRVGELRIARELARGGIERAVAPRRRAGGGRSCASFGAQRVDDAERIGMRGRSKRGQPCECRASSALQEALFEGPRAHRGA
jgi:hypothetical protein